ncbi:hypothetical protein ACWGR4_21910 [Embleya sp. NPDC055664]|uniref:hypothetical protein n=1 Tax=Embleya sp. NPDC059237 TaxID=3346784 RepID=UPI0036CC53E7
MRSLTPARPARPVSDPTPPAGRRPPRARRFRAAAAAAVVVVLLPATAACGGGSEGRKVASADGGTKRTADAPGTGDGRDDTARARDFAKCMRDNGVPVQDPDPNTGKLDLGPLRGGADAPTVRKAMQACRDRAPQSVTNGSKPTEKQLEAMRQLARCMRDAGIAFNDPGPDGFDKSSFPTGAPGFAAAMQKCQAGAPAGGAK